MLPLPRGAVWQTLFLICAVLFLNEVRSEGRVVCYYTNWSVYRPGTAKFNPQNINPYLCTHLVYAFGGFTKDNQMKPFDKYQDIEQGGYAKFTGLKTYNKQLKTMIAIGGWNEASSRFSPLMANPERRQQFIKNILKFLRQNHFDGIDLDWEYPAQREGGKPRDRDNYAQFVQEVRAEFERESQKTGRPRLLLTMAVPAGIENIEKGYDIPKLNKYLDWFNVLSYDFHSSHEPSANHHAPLYSLEEESEYNYDAELNIDYSIKYYLKAGADRDKLVLGIPTYGRSYTLINEESTEIGAPSEGPGEQGDATREKGYLAYYEICQNLKEDPEWTVVQPNPNAMGPYAYRRNQWVGYDDEAIVRKKAQYVVEQGLGGIMFWAIDNDDFRGTCTGKPYPLIEAAKDAMLEGLGLGINEVAKPNSPKKPSRSRSRENSSSKLNRFGGSSEGKGSASRTTLSSGRRRIQSTTTTTTQAPETTIRLTNPEGSSLYIGGRVTTPAPPTTPDPGTDFKCEEEGFFQHPRDCKKYYWCLDSGPSGLGIVGHQFTCPSGLYFNPAADSCDFARNVPCKTKKATTAAPISSTTTTTTTPRPTVSINRISAATSRTSFFRTTTTTTAAPEEYEDEEEEEVENAPAHTKDRDAEEDPQVIKELIELIRKVGGLEELEKHLHHKDDGTISIKGGSSEAGVATTPTPISKNLYDKVLSKPNTFNSFRNRFTSSSLFRKSGQTKTEESTNTKLESEESQSSEGASSSGYSKYSSVVRGNSRQGPQNEGLDKLTEFDGFLKEKKQYVTINRHRGAFRGQEDEDEVEERQTAEEVNENAEGEELSSSRKTTKRPTNTITPSYASIKRTRPTTLRTETDDEAEGSDEEVKTVKESEERRTYTSLNRNRGRFTTTESSAPAEEVVTNTNRYKYLERTRPTNRLQTSASSQDDDEEEQEDEQNVTVQLNGAALDSTQKSTQTTTRIYANIGRRTTTTTPTTETPITTQETPTRYNLLENSFNNNNETPEPILPTTTTTVTTANDSPALSITIKNTNPQLIPIATKQTITTTSQPIISTTNAAATTTTSNDIELTDTKSIVTTLPSNFESDSKDALDLSLDVNSLIEKSALSPNESPKDIEHAETTTARTTKPTTTTETLTSTATGDATTATSTDTDQNSNGDEVTNLNNNRTKTQYKFITRTRNVTKATTATTTNTDIDTENESENNKIFKETKQTSLKTGSSSSTDDKLSSNIRGNTVKYSGGRRQQQQQQTSELLTRNNQIQNQQTDSTTDATNSITTTEPTPTNEFLGTISSPRPFGYPRRRTRPNNTQPTNNNADTQTTTTESSEDEPTNIVKTRLTATSASKNKVRTPTATTIVTATAQTRRPVVSVRRRKINSPNASSGIAYQTATTSLQTSQTSVAATTTTTTANADASTKSDELLIITTELPTTTTFNKQQFQRNRNKLVTPAVTAATTTDDLTAPTTTTTQQFTAAVAAITLSNANNQKSYLNTKYRAKLPAASLSTISASLATEIPNVNGAAEAAATTTTASNDIIQQANVNTNANTKQPSTVLRRKFQTRRLITTTTTSATDDSATEQPRTPNPLFKRRFSLAANPSVSATTILAPSTNTPADALTTTLFVDGFDAEDASDQVAKSSVHTNHFNQFVQNAEDNEAQIPQRALSSGIKASPLKSKPHTAVTTTTHAPPSEPRQPYVESITRRMGTVAATTEFTAAKRKSVGSKRRPQKYTPTTPQTSTESLPSRRGQSAKETVNRRRPNKFATGDTFERLNGNQAAPAKPATHVSTSKASSNRPVVDYDYYDDENERVVGNTEGQQLKVILHGRGIIECLDQGNFPHPLSCRKFISCAKFETGGVVGWEYTCPKGLSYDPVGGMCNWAAGLGCKE
uniref:chitinase n=1 Tax=Zeugodacus cucurbitae TaxID=28588 RepID=A0A0A1WK98_ZEUCU